MFKKIIFTIFFGVLLAGCSTSVPMRTSSDFNPDIDISHYKTFSWIADQPYIRSGTFLADSSREKINNNIYNVLLKKGYVFVSNPEEADFVVSYTVGSRKEISAKSYPTYYRSGWTWGQTYWGGGGYFVTGTYSPGVKYTGTDINVRTYTQGQLAIDIFDVKAHQPAWHGVGLKEITTKDRKDPRAIIQTAVRGILESFPSNQN